MDRKAHRAVKDNHLSWINLGYLSVAAIATVWVLVDVYSALVPDGLQNSASTENLLSSLLNLPILAGGLLFLFALYRYPLRDQDRHDWVDPSQTDSAILEDCLVLPHASEIEAKRHRSAQVEGDLTLKVGADAPLDAISEISLPYGSTIVFSDSIALDIDDYLSDEYEDIEGIDNVYADQQPETVEDQPEGALDPLMEAATYANFGQYDFAVNALLDAIANERGNPDNVAVAVFEYLDEEMSDPSTTDVRIMYLVNRKDEIAMDFIKNNLKLSQETWQKIQPANQAWEAQPDDAYMDEPLLVNWR